MRSLILLTINFIPSRLRRFIPFVSRPEPQSRPQYSQRPSEDAETSAADPSARTVPPPTCPNLTTPKKPNKPPQASDQEDDQLGTQALAKRLGVSDQTVRNWRRDGKIHGVRSGRSYVFPASQIMSATQNRPAQRVPGLEDVFKGFASTDEAWAWLTTEMSALRTDSKPSDTPIQALRQGRRASVLELM